MLSRGNCWLGIEGIPDPIPLTGGDCFLLGRETSIVMRDSPRTRPRSTFREIAAKAKGNVAHLTYQYPSGFAGGPVAMAFGDFNGDGNMDMALISGDNAITPRRSYPFAY